MLKTSKSWYRIYLHISHTLKKSSAYYTQFILNITYHHTVGENGLELIDPTIITKSFKKCSISKDLDVTEDDVLWAEQYDKSDTDKEGNGM